MTTLDGRGVRRRTPRNYRVTISGARPDDSGRALVVELRSDQTGDYVRIREAGRRRWVTLDIPELYRRALISEARGKRGRK